MVSRIRKSASSSNFWNNVGTLGAIIIESLAGMNGQETQGMSMSMLFVVAIFNVTNIMYHLNTEK